MSDTIKMQSKTPTLDALNLFLETAGEEGLLAIVSSFDHLVFEGPIAADYFENLSRALSLSLLNASVSNSGISDGTVLAQTEIPHAISNGRVDERDLLASYTYEYGNIKTHTSNTQPKLTQIPLVYISQAVQQMNQEKRLQGNSFSYAVAS